MQEDATVRGINYLEIILNISREKERTKKLGQKQLEITLSS